MSNSPTPSTRVDQFVALSSVLTGFTTDTLAPPLDPTDPPLKQVYLDVADQSSAQTVDSLLAEFATLSSLPPQAIADKLLEVDSTSPPTANALMARSILKLWYLGSWYPPESVSATDGNVVSMNGYIGGLAWSAMQAHPMGFSQLKFGYWNSPPPKLSGVLPADEATHG
jgi:hypothetical protein